ncbi:hypothetical protein ASZ90_017290 [hydrocarbon metagenome]|uniref:Uncharacterized protein n=1 Tax=hydrocarbon metagenome TaxID=938273 RepID=A0A0W8E9Z4_9ZZZZ
MEVGDKNHSHYPNYHQYNYLFYNFIFHVLILLKPGNNYDLIQ